MVIKVGDIIDIDALTHMEASLKLRDKKETLVIFKNGYRKMDAKYKVLSFYQGSFSIEYDKDKRQEGISFDDNGYIIEVEVIDQ